jgi:preprotein translocase subunit YajC
LTDALALLQRGLVTLAETADSATPPAAPQTAQADPSTQLVSMLGMLVPLGLVFWLLIIRPESKRRKEREQVLNAVKVKDRVVTIGGLYGTVVDIEKDEIVLLVDPKKDVKMRFRRGAIDSVERPGENKSEKR